MIAKVVILGKLDVFGAILGCDVDLNLGARRQRFLISVLRRALGCLGFSLGHFCLLINGLGFLWLISLHCLVKELRLLFNEIGLCLNAFHNRFLREQRRTHSPRTILLARSKQTGPSSELRGLASRREYLNQLAILPAFPQ